MIARVVVTSFKSLRQKHFKLQIKITTGILFFCFEENTILKTFPLIVMLYYTNVQYIHNSLNIIKASSVEAFAVVIANPKLWKACVLD